MAWSRGPGSENIFFAGFWAQNDQFWGRNKFQNAKQFRISKAKTSSAVCLEFAETLFFNPFFETAGALEFLSHADCCTPLASPDIIPSFPRFFGVQKRRPLVAPARAVGRATRDAGAGSVPRDAPREPDPPDRPS